VPGNQTLARRRAKARQVAVDDVQVGVAHAAGVHLDQDFVGLRLGNGQLFERERRMECGQDSGFHGGSSRLR